MKDKDGVCVGESGCVNYLGVDRYETTGRACCGGRRHRVAFAKCVVKGVVRAEPDCSKGRCDKIQEQPQPQPLPQPQPEAART